MPRSSIRIVEHDKCGRTNFRHGVEHLGLLLERYRVGQAGDLSDLEARWPPAYQVTPAGAVLICPDGFVAWRAAELAVPPDEVLAKVFEQLLGRAASFSR